MSLLTLIRHAESDANNILEKYKNHPAGSILRAMLREEPDRYIGLTNKGYLLAKLFGVLCDAGHIPLYLDNYDTIITTGYIRTLETVKAIYGKLPRNIEINDEYAERKFGFAHIMTDEDIKEYDKLYGTELYHEWGKDPAYFIPPEGEGLPEGESLSQVWNRTIAALEDTLALHEGEDILLVIHGETGNMVDAYANGVRNVEDYILYKKKHKLKNMDYRNYEVNGMEIEPLMKGRK